MRVAAGLIVAVLLLSGCAEGQVFGPEPPEAVAIRNPEVLAEASRADLHGQSMARQFFSTITDLESDSWEMDDPALTEASFVLVPCGSELWKLSGTVVLRGEGAAVLTDMPDRWNESLGEMWERQPEQAGHNFVWKNARTEATVVPLLRVSDSVVHVRVETACGHPGSLLTVFSASR